MALQVTLRGLRVGHLTRAREDLPWSFVFEEAYLDSPSRPILGQAFEDDPAGRWLGREGRPPPFFANLLPEGALRRFYEAQYGTDEIALLGALGGDLPGAVRVRGISALEPTRPRFSLAGVQPKLSAVLDHEGNVTLPVGRGPGALIAKLPDRLFPNLPTLEYSTTKWAHASGIEVPDFDLLPVGDVPGLPQAWVSIPDLFAFVGHRFDRGEGGAQVHMEDFAQVFGRYPEQRYPSQRDDDPAADYRAIGSVISSLCPEDDLRQYVRRLVFMVLSGGADLHLKNWSLIYPDGRAARLSPAYDLIPDIALGSTDLDTTHAALRWCGRPEPHLVQITMSDFVGFASAWPVDEEELRRWVTEDRSAIRDAWSDLRGELPLEDDESLAIGMHLGTCTL